MTKHDLSDLEDLSAGEIDDIIHSDHVNAEQLNLLLAHTKHINTARQAEITELDERLKRIAARLKELEENNQDS